MSAATDVLHARSTRRLGHRRRGTRTLRGSEEALEALGRDAGLVLIFPTGVLDPQEAAAQAQAAAGDVRVAGMTGTGSITPSGAIESGCSAIAFDSSLPIGVGRALPPTRVPLDALPQPTLCSASTGTEARRAPPVRRLGVGRPG